MKALMDGTNVVQIVAGLSGPTGITVDYKSSTLFWVEYGKKVQSSRLDGSSVVTLARLSHPLWGIAVDETRVYFSSRSIPSVLRSCSKTGGDVKVLHKEEDEMQHIVLKLLARLLQPA